MVSIFCRVPPFSTYFDVIFFVLKRTQLNSRIRSGKWRNPALNVAIKGRILSMTQEFGDSLRFHRRQGHDPSYGGQLTQSRLGELLGQRLGVDGGYSGATISDWERNERQIHKDDRRVLVALIQVLHECGGLQTPEQAQALLRAGNYSSLDEDELQLCFPQPANTPDRPGACTFPTSQPVTDSPPFLQPPTHD